VQVLNQGSPDGLPTIDPVQLSKPAVVVGNATAKNFRSDSEGGTESRYAPPPPGSRIADLESELRGIKERILISKSSDEILAAREEYDRLSVLLKEAREEQAQIDKKNEPRVRWFQVMNDKPVRIAGTVVMHPGKIVDTLNYKISALKQNGVKLKEVEPENLDANVLDTSGDRMSGLN